MISVMNTGHFRELTLLASFAALAVGTAERTFAQNESLPPSTIVRLNGHARCSTDNGKTWRMVKIGETLESGSMIQTAKQSDLDLALGGRVAAQPDNLVTLAGDTLLKLDKVERRQVAGSKDWEDEISLDLRTGAIAGNVRSLNGASRYEITFPKGVAGMREGRYRLRANGELGVLEGKAFIALTDGRPAKEISASQQFNPASGTVTALAQATPPPVAQQAVTTTPPESTADSDPPAPPPLAPRRKFQPPSTGLRRAIP